MREPISLTLITACALVVAGGSLPIAEAAQSVTLAWDSNDESDLAHYLVHYGTTSGIYPDTVTVGKESTTTTINGLAPATTYFFAVSAVNSAGLESLPSNEVSTGTSTDVEAPAIQGRWVFYNNSTWDGNDPLANAADDAAIAPDKFPLFAGETASSANYTNFSRGINGIIIDVSNFPNLEGLSPSDFEFHVNSNWVDWTSLTETPTLTKRPGAGEEGSDRVTLVFSDNAIQNQWLRVTILANSNTGLASDDIFHFGNAIGDTGNSPTNAVVNGVDEAGIRANHRNSSNPGPITELYDINRDRFVNGLDAVNIRIFNTNSDTALKLITGTAELILASPSQTKAQTAARADDSFAASYFIHRDVADETVAEFRAPDGCYLEASEDNITWKRVDHRTDPDVWQADSQWWMARIDRPAWFFRVVKGQQILPFKSLE